MDAPKPPKPHANDHHRDEISGLAIADSDEEPPDGTLRGIARHFNDENSQQRPVSTPASGESSVSLVAFILQGSLMSSYSALYLYT